MKRGDVYDARLSPTAGSEQSGRRPVIIVSNDVLNQYSPVVTVVPCTTYRQKRIYATQVFIQAGEGGLTADSVALGEQIRTFDKERLETYRGTLSDQTMVAIETALLVVLDIT